MLIKDLKKHFNRNLRIKFPAGKSSSSKEKYSTKQFQVSFLLQIFWWSGSKHNTEVTSFVSKRYWASQLCMMFRYKIKMIYLLVSWILKMCNIMLIATRNIILLQYIFIITSFFRHGSLEILQSYNRNDNNDGTS